MLKLETSYMKLKSLFTVLSLTLSFTSNSFLTVKAENNNVAIISIFAHDGINSDSSSGFMNFHGHSFLTIENINASDLQAGKMIVHPKETISIGTWGNKSLHKGLWYNLKTYFAQNNEYDGSVSLSEYISYSQLENINQIISNNDTWRPLYNCSSFSTKVWNSISSITLDAGAINTPAHLKSSIKNYNYSINQFIPYNSNIGYYENNDFIYVDMNSVTSIANMLNPCSY